MIQVKGLNLKIKDVPVFTDLSFEIEEGSTCAILMGKKCGKTLLGALLSGAIDADGGEILIDGEIMCAENKALKQRVSFYSPDVEAFGFLTVREVLELFGESRNEETERTVRQVEEVLELTDLTKAADCSVRALNKEQKIKLGIATTLMGKPSLIIYDGIFDNTDDVQSEEIYSLVKMISDKKRTVLICNSPKAVKLLCDYAVFIDRGRCVLSESIENIENEINKTGMMRITVRGESAPILEKLSSVSGVLKVSIAESNDEVSLYAVEYERDEKIKDKLFSAMAEISSPILSYEDISVSLNDVYHSLISDYTLNIPTKAEKRCKK